MRSRWRALARWALLASMAMALSSGRPARAGEPVHVRILGLNDLHGQIVAGRKVAGRPVGSAGVLASWLRASSAGAAHAGPTFIALAGDSVGASPAASALLHDEPTIAFLNLLANEYCSPDPAREAEPRCNVIAGLGNHEFDEGVPELLRLWRGARFPLIGANVVWRSSGRPIVPPVAVQDAGGVPLAFIGAVVSSTPSLVTPSLVAGVRFEDEAAAINAQVELLLARRVRAIVVLLHEGGTQPPHDGPTRDDTADDVSGPIREIAWRLHPAVDLVVSGHVHRFTNARLPRERGEPVLVTQAWSGGSAFAEIDLVLDRATRDVVSSTARIVSAWADEGPGLAPAADAAALADRASRAVASLVERPVGELAQALTRAPDSRGQSALGRFVAESQRVATGADIAFMNAGGLRADLPAGRVTWGDAFAALPWGNTLVVLEMTGAQVLDVLAHEGGSRLQVSGLDPDEPRLDPARVYRVVVNSFLAAGGDDFTAFTRARVLAGGPLDVDALVAHLSGR